MNAGIKNMGGGGPSEYHFWALYGHLNLLKIAGCSLDSLVGLHQPGCVVFSQVGPSIATA